MLGNIYYDKRLGYRYICIEDYHMVQKDWNNDGEIYFQEVCFLQVIGNTGYREFRWCDIEYLELIKEGAN